VVRDIENHYAGELLYPPKSVRDLLQAYVDAGKLGVKAGESFYTYPEIQNHARPFGFSSCA
jgi:3-hydroxybutyryl-CoA dehydrogenase